MIKVKNYKMGLLSHKKNMTLRHYYYEIKKLHKDKVIIMTKTMTKNEINHNQDKKKYF